MRRTLFWSKEAVVALRRIERKFVSEVWMILMKLAEDPDSLLYFADEEDPSKFWVAVPGDCVTSFEIFDEQHFE